jgi:hypothetical protein
LPIPELEYLCPKSNHPPLNLSFEETENNLPKGWYISGSPSYKASIDTKMFRTARMLYSLKATEDTKS